MLSNGGSFEVIEICEGMEEPEVRQRENYWIDYYKNQEDWNVVNLKDAWSMIKKSNKPKSKKKIKHKYIKVKVTDKDYQEVADILKSIKCDKIIEIE